MKLASIFTNHMVFQAKKPIRIFGEGKGEISVKLADNFYQETVHTDEWCVELPPMEYGGPYEVEIKLDNDEIILEDVYIGEVWLAMGQSNMEMPVYRVQSGLDDAEYADCDGIRLFTVARQNKKNTPRYGWHFEKMYCEDTPWQACNSENVKHFSAMGYYTAKGLYKALGVHIGIISCNWGGTPIETFIAKEYFDRCDALKVEMAKYNDILSKLDMEAYEKEYAEYLKAKEIRNNAICYDEVEEARDKGLRATTGNPVVSQVNLSAGPYHQNCPSVLYENMVKKVIPFSVAGVLWYQGESNSCVGYADKYMTFMECIRDKFADSKLPFYAVELASFGSIMGEDYRDDRFITDNNWAFTREEQQKAVDNGENNYLITSMELGDFYDIHPPLKKELAQRMVKKVLKYSYGFAIDADQPIFDSVEFSKGKAVITLKNAEGLQSKGLSCAKMYLADESNILKRAKLTIENDKIIAECDEVKNPVLVRYGFDYYYSGYHIYNKWGLPLAPFRSDKG